MSNVPTISSSVIVAVGDLYSPPYNLNFPPEYTKFPVSEESIVSILSWKELAVSNTPLQVYLFWVEPSSNVTNSSHKLAAELNVVSSILAVETPNPYCVLVR